MVKINIDTSLLRQFAINMRTDLINKIIREQSKVRHIYNARKKFEENLIKRYTEYSKG